MPEDDNLTLALKAKLALKSLLDNTKLDFISPDLSLSKDELTKSFEIIDKALNKIFDYPIISNIKDQCNQDLAKMALNDPIEDFNFLQNIITTNLTVKERSKFVDLSCSNLLPIYKQLRIFNIPKSSFYYHPRGESDFNISLINIMDEIFISCPFYGVRRMTAALNKRNDILQPVNEKRVDRLMKLMGIQAIYPKPKLSFNNNNSTKYPYLLKNLIIDHPNHVWCTDITYIRMDKGFLYLVAIMDQYSRYILSWNLSNSLDSSFCIDTLQSALNNYPRPEIFNSDQGSQFISNQFQQILLNNKIKISLDHKGRCFDNIFIERFWRSLKYEEVYLKNYESVVDAILNIEKYMHFYNNERLHQSFDYKTPRDVFHQIQPLVSTGEPLSHEF